MCVCVDNGRKGEISGERLFCLFLGFAVGALTVRDFSNKNVSDFSIYRSFLLNFPKKNSLIFGINV